MKTKTVLTIEDARQVCNAGLAEAGKQGWAVSIAVVDDGGHPLLLERLDDCAPVASYISLEKARTAALGRRESKQYEEMINAGRTAFLSVPQLAGMLEGGLPILVGGQVAGAVGVSGMKPQQDSQIAVAATAAMGSPLPHGSP